MRTTGIVKGAIVVTKDVLSNSGSVYRLSGRTPGVSGRLGYLERGVAADGTIVFIDVGSNNGVKPGDLFIVYREAAVDTALYNRATDTEKLEGYRKAIGELVILKTGERASTALVTYAADAIFEGDLVERR
jgi:hypothetical protein